MIAATKWSCKVDAGKATLTCQITTDDNQTKSLPFKIKGLCYSPAPMHGRNDQAPALGDWFWDDFGGSGWSVTGWGDLWARDFPGIRALNANALRLYCMLSRQLTPKGPPPSPWDSGHQFEHKSFLDKCMDTANANAKPHYVLVGIPVPATMLWKTQYDAQPEATKTYWENVLRETAATVGNHPAVMGFTLHNEQDGADVCYNDPDLATFWWGQTEKFAAIVKSVAPDKLVGMATHDDPQIPQRASAYMQKCPHVDFWGVNTYQTSNLNVVFDPYSQLEGVALKPVILTEYGIPATGRRNPDDPASIYDDPATRNLTGDVIEKVIPQAYTSPLCIGMYYFEYCDEWWNQPEAPNDYTWYGGKDAKGFPNGYWDNEGFGLYSIRRGKGQQPSAPIWDGPANRPTVPIDEQIERQELTSRVKAIFEKID